MADKDTGKDKAKSAIVVPISPGEIIGAIGGTFFVLAMGFFLAYITAMPRFVSTAATLILGAVAFGQLVLEHWMRQIDETADAAAATPRPGKLSRREKRERRLLARAKASNDVIRSRMSGVLFSLAALTTLALGANLAGEAAEAKVICFQSDRMFSGVLPAWQAEAVCKH